MSYVYFRDKNFLSALPLVLKHEGFYSDDPHDAGGATQYGISLRLLKDLPERLIDANLDGIVDEEDYKLLMEMADKNKDGKIDKQDIKLLTIPDAANIYYLKFWLPSRTNEIVDEKIAIKVFDLGVTMGVKQVIKLLQRACNDSACALPLHDDGVMGPLTIKTVNQIASDKLLRLFLTRAESFYCYIAEVKPTNQKFLKGWLNRVYDWAAKT